MLSREDEYELKIIWNKYFKDDFAFPDFFKSCLCAIKVTDSEGNLVTAGGIKLIPELVMVTDLGALHVQRVRALKRALEFAKYAVKKNSMDHFHAGVKAGSTWEHHLLKTGFKESADKLLVLHLEN